MSTSNLSPRSRLAGRPTPYRLAALAVVAGLTLAGTAHAQQGQSMEERLRAQLRLTTSQLQQAQNELAALKGGGGVAAPAEVEKLEAQLKKERQERERQAASVRESREQAQAAVEKANAQLDQYRNAYNDLLKLARASEAQRQRLGAQEAEREAAVSLCTAKNVQLYEVGQEILQAYESVDVGTVLSSRQPFAAKARARYEEISQVFGDKLYGGRFSRGAVEVPAPPQAGQEGDSFSIQGGARP